MVVKKSLFFTGSMREKCSSMPDDHPAIEYFRLILKNGGREIANVIFGEHDEELVDRLVLRIGELSPATAIGYEEPPKPEKRKK